MIIENFYRTLFEKISDAHEDEVDEIINNNMPENIIADYDISYGENSENLYDVYYPKNTEKEKFTTILNIHGGGYVGGSKKQDRLFCMLLASLGYMVVNMEYTNANKQPFPTPIEEVYKVMKNLGENENYHQKIDYNNFFLSGDSAGGHIASLVANAQANDMLKYDLNLCGGVKIKGLILISPTFSAFNFLNVPILKNVMKNVMFGKDYEKEMPEICNVNNNLINNFPPAIIFSANNDFIKMHANKFCKNAKEFGIDVEHYIFTSGEKLGHDFIINYPHKKEGLFAISKIDKFIQNVQNNTLTSGVKVEKVDLNFKKKTKNKNLGKDTNSLT